MEIVHHVLFIFTALVTLLNFELDLSQITGHPLDFSDAEFLPEWLDVDSWILYLPCLVYQLWFWSDRFLFNAPAVCQ